MSSPIITLEGICTANQGRSLPFEVMARFWLAERGLDDTIKVESSGTKAGPIAKMEQGDFSEMTGAGVLYTLGKVSQYSDGTEGFVDSVDDLARLLHVLRVGKHDPSIYDEDNGFRDNAQELAVRYGTKLSKEEQSHRDHFMEQLTKLYGQEFRQLYEERVSQGPQQTVVKTGERYLLPMAASNMRAILSQDRATGIYAPAQERVVDVEDQISIISEPDLASVHLPSADNPVVIARLPYFVRRRHEDVEDAFGIPGAYPDMALQLSHLTKDLVNAAEWTPRGSF